MNILIDKNNRRYKILSCNRKSFFCKFHDSKTLKYCDHVAKKNGYCVRHENGQEKIKKQITKIDYNIAKQDEINSEIYIY